ncbi:uncharacterized protein BKCO1_100086 [Diplodia corticola]|uniref:Uncharacterized protein n=1 Tax=Diplodia corticola TaxID=236234 RepID=A0A1J9RJX3_9PEZI|nr:uncharacterized protein BKCO1_100086 [Diplodia corticola]OJD40777.1 hypothetical protein BKCO1_100086 [Diplodia corticola]
MPTSAGDMRPPAHPADGAATRPAKRVKLFAGAPDPAALEWDESALVNDWTPPVRRFLNRQFAGGGDDETAASKWRAVPTSRHAHLPTGFTQESPLRRDFLPAPNAERSFSFSSQPSDDQGAPSSHKDAAVTGRNPAVHSSPPPPQDDDDDDDDDDFIEHSIAVHDDTRSSQLAHDDDPSTDPLIDIDSSFNTTTTSSSSSLLGGVDAPPLPDARLPTGPRGIAALRDLPSAAHLQRIVPQTVVVTLLVGVVAVLPPRAVRTRRGRWRDLVELLVGDETATGLKISCWFAHDDGDDEDDEDGNEDGDGDGGEESREIGTGARRRRSGRIAGRAGAKAVGLPKEKKKKKKKKEKERDPLREALGSLRVQDVVLVENVALDTFRDRVFGYSLRKSIQKNQTRIELLARGGVDRAAGLAGVEKVERVKDWVWRLVNPGSAGPHDGRGGADAGAGARRAQDAYLPPDTQE